MFFVYDTATTGIYTYVHTLSLHDALPIPWPEGDPPSSGWPVLYVLDGEDNFAAFAVAARRLARAGARSGIAPGIVVGIGAGPLARRVRDYTPELPDYRIPAGKPAAGLETDRKSTRLNSSH